MKKEEEKLLCGVGGESTTTSYRTASQQILDDKNLNLKIKSQCIEHLNRSK
jgi:hypothetical protein